MGDVAYIAYVVCDIGKWVWGGVYVVWCVLGVVLCLVWVGVVMVW